MAAQAGEHEGVLNTAKAAEHIVIAMDRVLPLQNGAKGGQGSVRLTPLRKTVAAVGV